MHLPNFFYHLLCQIVGFKTEVDLLNHIQDTYSESWYSNDITAVVFDPSQDYSSVLPNDISYKIRIMREWQTDIIYKKKVYDMGPSHSSKYAHTHALSLSLSLSLNQSIDQSINQSYT